jgi:bis(5'-nucleosyl)-tetraphosphatase (symmetrical)
MRLVHSLSIHSTVTLGNHDLSLLAIAQRSEADQAKVNPDLRRVLFAPDRDVLIDWLRQQKFMHVDRTLGFAMVHAGIAPEWTIKVAEARAREAEDLLRGDGFRKLLRNMYGDKPVWNSKLTGPDRFRAIVNVFTRMRYCTPGGRIGFEEKGRPGTQKPGLYPWFDVPGHAPRSLPMVCGHWSTLGLFMGLGIYGIGMEPWFGIQSTSAGVWGVAVGFVTIIVVSLFGQPPSKETQDFVESVRYPELDG